MKLELPRGIRDIEVKEYEKINYLRNKFFDIARLFDFKIMEPSPIEMLSTLESKSGPNIKNEIYAFKDKGDREIALRFDLTVGLTRYVASRRDLPLPTKFATFAGVWRYDEPQLGRYRWFHQWDIEIYDNFSLESDAEVIEFTDRYLNSIGLDGVRIEINDRIMLENYLRDVLSVNEVDEYFRAMDKASKKSKEQLLKEYSMLDKNRLEHMLSFISKDLTLERLRELRFDTSRIEELLDSLKSRDVRNVKINISIVRGLDYYSGIVFEAFSNESKNAIVGGGRYDRLTEALGRRDLGATGAAGGIERIANLLKERKERIEKIYVAYDIPLKNEALSLASSLRREGIIAVAELSKRQLRKQLEYASKNDFCKAIILERDQMAKIKDIKSGEEYTIELSKFKKDIASYLKCSSKDN